MDGQEGRGALRSPAPTAAAERPTVIGLRSATAVDEWAAFYAAESVRMVRFATFVAGPDRALDVVQAAMLRAMRAGTEVHNRRAFVNRIIVREAQRFGEREQRREALELRVVPVLDDGDPSEAALPRPELHAAVRALSPQQRAVIFHTYWEDLTPSEVARLLGCSEGAVKRQLARARAKLREVVR